MQVRKKGGRFGQDAARRRLALIGLEGLAQAHRRLVQAAGDCRDERGSTIVLGALGIAILLIIFVGGANLVLDEYAKGAVRTAVDEAAQAGATAGGSVAACETEAEQVRGNLIRGEYGADVTITCQVASGLMLATASGDLPSLVPPVPRVHVSVTGVSVIEEAPAQ